MTDFGELFILESLVERYPYGNYPGFYDEVLPTFETVLAPDGKVVLQRAVSWVKKYREWFWRGPSPGSTPFPSPAEIGLVRGRHGCEGFEIDGIFAVRGRDFFALRYRSPETISLRRLSLKMETIWTRNIALEDPLVVSPSWAQPILIHSSEFNNFVTMNERGRNLTENELDHSDYPDIREDQVRTRFKRPRFVIGQTAEGEWLLIGY